MKRKCFILILICVLMFTSGCVKVNNEMTINKDKSVSLSMDFLLSDQLLKSLTDMGVDPNSNFSDLTKKGLLVEDVTKDGYSGKKITVKYANIDDISDEKEFDVIINSFYEDDFNKKYIFKVKTGFLQNTYSAKLSYDSSSTDVDNEEYKDLMGDKELTEEEEKLLGQMESTFTVNLPYASISNNASAVSNGGKKLVWDFVKEPNKNIEFSFKMWNQKNLYIAIGCGSVLFVFLLVLTIIIIKRRRNSVKAILKHGPIHTDYDPSIENELKGLEPMPDMTPTDMLNNYEAPMAKNDNNFEYSLPEEEAAKVAAQTPAPKAPMFVQDASTPDIEFLDLGGKK